MMGRRLGAVKPPAHRQRARGGLDGRSIASVFIGLFDHDGQEDVEIADGIRAKNSTFHLDAAALPLKLQGRPVDRGPTGSRCARVCQQ